MEVRIRRIKENAVIPTKGSSQSAGYDLYACIDNDILIKPHETVMIETGISIELPDNTFGAIFPRSGISTKRGLAPANKVGVCDSDYRGEYIVALHNHSNITQIIKPFERIAQLIVLPYINVELVESDMLLSTERGDGSFGSTGR